MPTTVSNQGSGIPVSGLSGLGVRFTTQKGGFGLDKRYLKTAAGVKIFSRTGKDSELQEMYRSPVFTPKVLRKETSLYHHNPDLFSSGVQSVVSG